MTAHVPISRVISVGHFKLMGQTLSAPATPAPPAKPKNNVKVEKPVKPVKKPSAELAPAKVPEKKAEDTRSWFQLLSGWSVPAKNIDTREERVAKADFKIPEDKQKVDPHDSTYDTLNMMPDLDWSNKELEKPAKVKASPSKSDKSAK